MPEPRREERPIAAAVIEVRRQRVLLVLSGVFLASMTMLNILGVTRLVDLSVPLGAVTIPLVVPIGVLPYPVTFLCTDLISELFGRARAGFLVWVGLLCNVWLFFILWLAGELPGVGDGNADAAFFAVRTAALGSVVGSMIAYLAAQFCDVHLFHWIKRMTGGRHLWLRNNGSTLVSQFVDTVAVLSIAHYYAGILPVDESRAALPQLMRLIAAAYVFKAVCAVLDTLPAYWLRARLAAYLHVDPAATH